MPYRSYVYQKALNILERRRSHAESDLQRRTEEAMQKIPELAEIQQELARTGPFPPCCSGEKIQRARSKN